jgi:hypothetical protein
MPFRLMERICPFGRTLADPPPLRATVRPGGVRLVVPAWVVVPVWVVVPPACVVVPVCVVVPECVTVVPLGRVVVPV